MSSSARFALAVLGPLALLALLLAVFVSTDPTRAIRGDAPPVEELVFERVTLGPAGIEAVVINDGPDPVRIAQVQVDEAYWMFEMEPADGVLGHLERGVVRLGYPWVEGEAHELRLVSATGVTFDHGIEVALTTPVPSWEAFWVFASIGLYVGVIPVALGLLWYPMVRRLGDRGLGFVLALTVGLLLFLLVDSLHEGLEVAGEVASSLQGVAALVFAALLSYVAIEAGGRMLSRDATSGRSVAMLVAIGIGLHNLAEGLAIGAAFALGEVTLGTLLIVGFMLHNTTEGLAIVSPLGEERASLRYLCLLGLVAGAPTIAGAWLGGFAYSTFWSVVFLGAGAGAIAQVVVQITRSMTRRTSLLERLSSAPVAGGLAVGVLLMYATGLLVG
ncbi:MAG TPA: metal transporter [Thermoanaerobaculia bacterium]|nr:metal transporter [Thermoanaerobaculia bacterium]